VNRKPQIFHNKSYWDVCMIEGLDCLLEGSGQPGLPELRALLRELLGEADVACRLTGHQQLKKRVHRLQIDAGGLTRSLVVKCLDPEFAQRNQFVTKRWLPAVGLGECGPVILGAAAERRGECVWHIYEDFGDWSLDTADPDPEQVAAVVELIVQVHTRFARHPLLSECRRYGGDLGIYFYSSNVRDAIRALESLGPLGAELTLERLDMRDRMLARMYKLLAEQPYRAQALAELGGPETLLHGDLWTTNTFAVPSSQGMKARLIDWDHAGVGPACYDLSTFLLRFPAQHRPWILDLYTDAAAHAGWLLPSARELNLLFDTAECARFANCAVWPVVALLKDHAEWGFDMLAEVESWFERLEPVIQI
jgi:hypothetical protein